MSTIPRLLVILAAVACASPAYAQPFLYSMRTTPPSGTIWPPAYLVITNARTGEVVNADDPPLLGQNEGFVQAMTTSVDGKRLYLSVGFVRPRLLIMNLVTNRVETVVPMATNNDPWMLIPDPTGQVIYGSNPLSGRVTVFDAGTGQTVRHIQLDNAFTMALSADGSVMAVTEPPVNKVSLLDPRTGTVRFRVNIGGAPQRVAITPDGTRAFVTAYLSSPGGTFITIDTATGAIVNSTRVPGRRGCCSDRIASKAGS